jgi:hypothetical protein
VASESFENLLACQRIGRLDVAHGFQAGISCDHRRERAGSDIGDPMRNAGMISDFAG